MESNLKLLRGIEAKYTKENILDLFKFKLNDKMLEIHLFVCREGAFKKEYKCIVFDARESLKDFNTDLVLEENKKEGWELDRKEIITKGIGLEKSELIELRKALRVTNQDNKKKTVELGLIVKKFISKYDLYNKPTEQVVVDYIDTLLIYPIRYTQKILKYENFPQKALPTLGEIEDLIRYTDGYNSQAYYEINNSFEEIDCDDELF